ncbi:MAG: Pullulanase precursor [Planctomycetota bacterium]|jgi:pullulanase
MLRILLVLAALIVPTAVVAPVAASPDDFPRLAAKLDPKDFSADGRKAESLLVVHYNRPSRDYAGWNLWCWAEGGEGSALEFGRKDAFGVVAIVPFAKTPARAGFIVRRGNWEEKDFDQDRFVPLERGRVTEIWVTSGEPGFSTDPSKLDLGLKLESAFLDGPDTVTIGFSRALEADEKRAIEIVDRRDPKRKLTTRSVSDGRVVRVALGRDVNPGDIAALEVRVGEKVACAPRTATVFARGVLESSEFSPLDARFGAFCTPQSTEFATWSPVSDLVELVLLEQGPAAPPTRIQPLERGEKGRWSATVAGDLHGVHYRYRFHAYGAVREAPDMWAFAANADSTATVVADLARLEPEGFRSIEPPVLAQPTDEILYEVHVRDYSKRHTPTPKDERGTYLGLTRNIAHLEELGVTAVHLLPVHDYTAKVGEYNWGYWTTLFNVPESNYSSDPADPFAAIRDLRAMVTRLHAARLRVILDVVYNHTSDAGPGSPFGAPAPFYFFRTTPGGRLTNDSGTGNGFADERPMARKYILDSVEHWLRNYRVDGFRFDLLGCHKPETVRAICERVRAIRPDATLYGEPWTGGGPIHFGKGAQKGLSIAVFNDHLRNAIRGDLDGTTAGFATGPGGDVAAIRRGVAGAIDDFAQEPAETINYASAHDNLILWDKIAKTQPGAPDAIRRAMQKLALGVVLTSQGIPFLHGGCEFARTKQGNHNSYDAGDDINDYGWQRKDEYRDIFDFTAGLARLRREHPAFRMDDDAEVRRALRFLPGERPVAFTLDGSVSGDPWKTVLVAYNDEPDEQFLELPAGDWTVVVDAARAGTAPLRTQRGKVKLPPYSMLVAYQP